MDVVEIILICKRFLSYELFRKIAGKWKFNNIYRNYSWQKLSRFIKDFLSCRLIRKNGKSLLIKMSITFIEVNFRYIFNEILILNSMPKMFRKKSICWNGFGLLGTVLYGLYVRSEVKIEFSNLWYLSLTYCLN